MKSMRRLRSALTMVLLLPVECQPVVISLNINGRARMMLIYFSFLFQRVSWCLLVVLLGRLQRFDVP